MTTPPKELAEALARHDKETRRQIGIRADAIAKERQRQRPRVWWANQQLLEDADKNVRWDYVTYSPDEGTDTPFIITDGRVVGETPEDELQVLAHAQGFSTHVYRNNRLHRLYSRLAKANAAIAAARKGGG